VSKKRKNITFVEVMLSTAVLAILAAIVIPFFTRANQKGHYTKWKTHKNKLQLDPTLTAYYDFSDGKGSILTNSARSKPTDTYNPIDLDGRILNTTSWKKSRWQLKWALQFNGESTHVLTNGDFTGNAVTVVCWFKSDTLDTSLLSFTDKRSLDSAAKRNLYLKGGYVVSSNPKGAIKSKTKCAENKWTMVAVTMGQKFGKHILYINGDKEAESSSFEVSGDSLKSLIIGYCSNAPFFKGFMDDVVVFKRELSDKEIKDIYIAGKP